MHTRQMPSTSPVLHHFDFEVWPNRWHSTQASDEAENLNSFDIVALINILPKVINACFAGLVQSEFIADLCVVPPFLHTDDTGTSDSL